MPQRDDVRGRQVGHAVPGLDDGPVPDVHVHHELPGADVRGIQAKPGVQARLLGRKGRARLSEEVPRKESSLLLE